MTEKYWLIIEGQFKVKNDGTVIYEETYDPKKCAKIFDPLNGYNSTDSATVDRVIGHYIALQE